jgi:hypothetical protein
MGVKRFIKLHIVLIFLSVFMFSAFDKHEEYYSLTNIQYKESEKSLQIVMRFFVDDFDSVLKSVYEQDFELGTTREINSTNDYILQYLQSHFDLIVEGQRLKFNWVGKEYKKDAIYIYLEIPNTQQFKEIKVKNTCFLETYKSQENIVKFKVRNQYKTLILNAQKPIDTVIFS